MDDPCEGRLGLCPGRVIGTFAPALPGAGGGLSFEPPAAPACLNVKIMKIRKKKLFVAWRKFSQGQDLQVSMKRKLMYYLITYICWRQIVIVQLSTIYRAEHEKKA